MEAILILALLFIALVALGLYASVKAIGAARRGVDRTISQARRSFEDTTLRAKSVGALGLSGELAQLRLQLRTSMRATQEILRASAPEDASLSESVALFQRLSGHGRELDDELRQLERDPDRARIAERMLELRGRTERITRSADSLRWAARDRARRFAEEDLSSLSAQIDVESGALRHWSAVDPSLGDRPAVGDSASGTDWTGAVNSGASTAEGRDPGVLGQDWPEPQPGEPDPTRADQAPSEPPPAPGPRPADSQDPPRGTGRPWGKQAGRPRPETTN